MPKAVYIHIPFCSSICSYCDFAKFYYNSKLVDKYLIALEDEINSKYNHEKITTLYIGGGSPSSLNKDQFLKLLSIINKFSYSKNREITIEINPNINKEMLDLICKSPINRVSIGVQTFNSKLLKILNRYTTYEEVEKIILYLKKNHIKNINLDLMYGIQKQNMKDVLDDLDKFIELNPEHISTYCLIKEEHTILDINNYEELDDETQKNMYYTIKQKLEDNNYCHYELSNYAKKGYLSKHNLVYWNNEKYYGFGLSAAGYIKNIRYDNTRNLNKYLNHDYVYEKHKLTKNERMSNEMILGLRKISGVNSLKFYKKYHIQIDEVFNLDKLKKNNDNYIIPIEYLFVSNCILVDFIID